MKVSTIQESSDAVDLTPMLDVVFILLIFFIITASFMRESSLDLASKPSDSKSNQTSVPLVFTVQHNNEILIDRQRVDIRSLRARIAEAKALESEQFSVLINAHETAAVDTYVAILDALRTENVSAVSIGTFN